MKKKLLIVIAGLTIAFLGAIVLYQRPNTLLTSIKKLSFGGDPSIVELMQSGGLEEMAIGNPSAPNTIIEYASLTCPHCAHFHRAVFPELKSKFVDTGMARFIFRDFPLDAAAVAAAMLARCADKQHYFVVIDALFESQDTWAHAKEGDAAIRLFELFHKQGMSKEQFNSCLADRELFKNIVEATGRAHQLGVEMTPTLFVNGKRLENAGEIEDIEAVLEQSTKVDRFFKTRESFPR